MHKFEIVPGLPPYGPEAVAFSSTGLGLHSEGLVVRFMPQDARAWYGNFISGLGAATGVYAHPDQAHAVVVSGGQVYVVDPALRNLIVAFGADIDVVFDAGRRLVFIGNTDCYIVESSGELWSTRRLSWDGIKGVSLRGELVSGEAASLEDEWVPFHINLSTREVFGGSYPST